MDSRLCTWCMVSLIDPSSQISIDRGPDDSDEVHSEIWRRLSYASLSDKAELILDAFNNDRHVRINNYTIKAPVTTWNGDLVCEVHLAEQARAARDPRTVRMEQWGPRRAGRGY